MSPFVNQTQKVNGFFLKLIVNEKWEWFGPSTRIAVRTNMVSTASADDFTSLPSYTLVERTGKTIRDFTVAALFTKQVLAELTAEDRFHCGLPNVS
jgi:hypothetical protein